MLQVEATQEKECVAIFKAAVRRGNGFAVNHLNYVMGCGRCEGVGAQIGGATSSALRYVYDPGNPAHTPRQAEESCRTVQLVTPDKSGVNEAIPPPDVSEFTWASKLCHQKYINFL